MFLDPSLLVRAGNTTFDAAAGSSSILQCYDIRHCRTVQSIIFGCFSTVFLCTWTALHLNIPYPSLLGRVGWMMTAIFAPEVWFIQAFEEWANSSYILEKILTNYPNCEWTETHAQFVIMNGFRLVGANGKKFRHCVEDGTIDLPEVSKEEILLRSKGDLTAKIITVIQTAWFVFQCIHRRSQHLVLTQLEITVLAHTVINFFIYFCWWHKPYGVTLPIEVPFRERRPIANGGRNDKAESEGGSLNGNDKIQMPQIAEKGENPTVPTQPSISNDAPSKASEKGSPPVAPKSSEDESLAAAADKELRSDIEVGNDIPSTLPKHSWYTRSGIKVHSVAFKRNKYDDGWIAVIFLSTIFCTFGGGFGAMHCLAWNSAFPTRAEQYTWQVSSLIVTVIGSTTLMYLINQRQVDHFLDNKGAIGAFLGSILILIPGIIYCCARISLIVLALLQLRALPYAAYETPSWTIFYPHIS